MEEIRKDNMRPPKDEVLGALVDMAISIEIEKMRLLAIEKKIEKNKQLIQKSIKKSSTK